MIVDGAKETMEWETSFRPNHLAETDPGQSRTQHLRIVFTRPAHVPSKKV